jgi:hypothetical protein
VAVETSIRNLSIGGYTGSWSDSAGNAGTAVIVGVSGAVGTGGARPGPTSALLPNSVSTGTIVDGAVTGAKIVDGAVGLAKINTAEVQRRVSGTCGVGSFIRSIDASGNVVCGSAPTPTTLSDENAVVNSFSACEDLVTLNFGTVAAGTLTCTATVHSVFDHVNPTTSRLEFGIETTAASCTDTQAGIFEMPGVFPSVTGHDTSVTVNRTFAVSAGTLTAYLNARALFIASANELSHNFSCTFTPQ